jgi:hypothetical protein
MPVADRAVEKMQGRWLCHNTPEFSLQECPERINVAWGVGANFKSPAEGMVID